MATSHIPGPWRFVDREVMEDGSVYPCHIVGGDAEFQVCLLESPLIAKLSVEDPDRYPGRSGVMDPTARLIEAAPELLEALIEVTASLAWGAHGECRAIQDGPIMPSSMAVEVAKKAIAKARGTA